MYSKVFMAGALGVSISLLGFVLAVVGETNLAIAAGLISLAIVIGINCIVHRELVRRNSSLLQSSRSELRENRLIIKDVRNMQRRDSQRLEKSLSLLTAQLKQLQEDSFPANPASQEPRFAISSKWSRDIAQKAGGWSAFRRLVFNSGTSFSWFEKTALKLARGWQSKILGRLAGVVTGLTAKPNGTEVNDDVESTHAGLKQNGITVIRPATQNLNGNPDFDEQFLFKSTGPSRRTRSTIVDSSIAGRKEASGSGTDVVPSSLVFDETHFEKLTERIESWRVSDSASAQGTTKRRVLIVTSNGAGLGHLTRMSAVERWLDADSLIYTMSSAYHRLGKSSKDIMYFPSHGDLGMNGRQWNVLMESNFSAVVKGFRPDAILFDGTYVYRGVVGAAKKFGVPLIWMQRGCWKEDVDKRSKQRHKADSFCQDVIIPGDYGCNETVKVSSKFEPHYVAPVTLNIKDDLLSRSEARRLLGLPLDRKLFLVQLGAGVINDIGDLRTCVVRAVQDLGSDWEPVLVRNPLSGHNVLPEVLSIQAFPLGLYYNAFDAGAFAAGYNTVQESVTFELPGLFIPNAATKTDDQIRRAREIFEAGLGLVALDLKEVEAGVAQLADEHVRNQMISQMRRSNRGNGAKEAAQIVNDLISR